MKKLFYLLLLFFIAGNISAQKFEALALTPPMGWNSWNTFQANIDERLVKETADMLVSSGMKAAGYTYLVLDDGWMEMQRDSLTGNLVADLKKFPHGMKAVADYVHAKGLKFGLYNCAGTKTCGGYPGTRGYEYQDARLYASWDVDYLKYDWCNTEGINAKEAYTTMSKALRAARRPIVFSLCEWGDNKPWEWAKDLGQLWRTTGDIYNCFDCIKDHGTWKSWGVMQILDKQKGLRQYAGPGHWNDPDMMEAGNGMPVNEDRAHFSMWCMLAAPLIAGNDVRKMNKETVAVLTNKGVIAVNQDALGIEAFRYMERDSVETWVKPLNNNEWALCFLNRATGPRSVKFDWKQHIITDSLTQRILNASIDQYWLHNLWEDKADLKTSQPISIIIPGHDIVMYRMFHVN